MSTQKNKKENKDNQPNRWIVLSGIGFQMGATIFLCAWGGKKLDAHYLNEDQNYFTIGLVLFGVIASIFLLIKQLKRLED
jgi:hypothetical protein